MEIAYGDVAVMVLNFLVWTAQRRIALWPQNLSHFFYFLFLFALSLSLSTRILNSIISSISEASKSRLSTFFSSEPLLFCFLADHDQVVALVGGPLHDPTHLIPSLYDSPYLPSSWKLCPRVWFSIPSCANNFARLEWLDG